MACKHATTCPLFPKLNGNLAGWRQTYCDTPDTWADCARFQRSLSGKPVPIALLPNGHIVEALDKNKPNERTGQATPRPVPQVAAKARPDASEVKRAERTRPPIVVFFSRLFGSKAAA